MSLTTEATDRSYEFTDDATMAPEALGSPSVERWLEVMYGIRPNATLRASFAPITHRYEGDVAEWLHRLWGMAGTEAISPSASVEG